MTTVIAMVTAGFSATVAPLGTALTEDQLALLWKMSDEPILCFDGDDAGQRAAAAGFPRVGDDLPDVTAFDENGKPFPLKQKLKGKHAVIVFGCLT